MKSLPVWSDVPSSRGFWSLLGRGMALPPCGQTNMCKNITFLQLLFAGGNEWTLKSLREKQEHFFRRKKNKTGRKQGSMYVLYKQSRRIYLMPCKNNEHGNIESICTTKASSLTYMLYLNITKLLRLAPIKNVNKYLNCVFAVNARLLNSDDKYYNVAFQLKPFVKCRQSAGDFILNVAEEEENFSLPVKVWNFRTYGY